MRTTISETYGETHDGKGAGDRDITFVWGMPRQYLTVLCQARLTVMRGEVMDYRHGEQHGGAADGDLSWTEQTETGLHVPISGEPLPDPSEYDG